VRPWVITNEGDIWFTKKKDGQALYAMIESDHTVAARNLEGIYAALSSRDRQD